MVFVQCFASRKAISTMRCRQAPREIQVAQWKCSCIEMQSLVGKHLRSQGFWWLHFCGCGYPEMTPVDVNLQLTWRCVRQKDGGMDVLRADEKVATIPYHMFIALFDSLCFNMSNSNLLHGLRNVFPSEEILTGRYLRIDSDAATSPSVEWLLTSKLGFLQLPIVRTVPPWDVGAALLFLATIFSEGLSFVSVGVLGDLRNYQNMAKKHGSVRLRYLMLVRCVFSCVKLCQWQSNFSNRVVGRILSNLSALHGYIFLSHDTVLPSLLPPCHLSSAQAPSGSQGLLARGTTVDSSIARKVNHQSTVMSWQGKSFKWNS